MNEYIGMKWKEVPDGLKKMFLNNAVCIDGVSCNEIKEENCSECIVDLTDNLSVAGKIVDNEIIIDDNEVIYSPYIL